MILFFTVNITEDDNVENDDEIEKEEGVAEDFTALKKNFLKLLEKASAAVAGSHRSARRHLVLIIDALNQLDESYNAHSLDWLPRELPKVSKFVMMCEISNRPFSRV